MNSVKPARKRLMKDLSRLEKDSDDGIFASPIDDDIFKWEAIILGPEDTPWENGIFKLKINFSDEYPLKAPVLVFLTKIFHPNGNYYIYF